MGPPLAKAELSRNGGRVSDSRKRVLEQEQLQLERGEKTPESSSPADTMPSKLKFPVHKDATFWRIKLAPASAFSFGALEHFTQKWEKQSETV
ncbi:hypothetical protein DUI87_15350 [Hirundo rustica rustica]|uniref:Uncharacterized protein n=1 Tax=Hirundo rustica rustica TaxID=333673 RepID=A0A3M0K3L7_HIRRU|nr:hypothetical protein DUI87_15350 [Hirundo rustica rustica]